MRSLWQELFRWTTEGTIVPKSGHREYMRWVPGAQHGVADWLTNTALYTESDSEAMDIDELHRLLQKRPAAIQVHTDGGFEPATATGAAGNTVCIWTPFRRLEATISGVHKQVHSGRSERFQH